MKKLIAITALIPVLAIFLFFNGCKKKDKEPTPATTELIINDKVIIVDTTMAASTLILISDSAELNQGIFHYQYTGTPPDFIANSTVIVGQEGAGYMRKVTNVTKSGNEITLQTQQAKLTDVIDQCDIQDAVKLDLSTSNKRLSVNGKPVNMRVAYLAEGVSIMRSKDNQGNIISLSNTTLYSGNVGGANLTATITNGSVEFEPTFNKKLKIRPVSPHIRELSLSAVGNINFDCDLQLVCSAPVTFSKEIPIAIFEFGPIMIGPVPMFIGLYFYAGFEAGLNLTGTVGSGFNANESVEFGAEYLEGQWSTIWNKSGSFTKHPVTWSYDGNVLARVYVAPQVRVTLAAIAGPYLEVEPYLEFDGDIMPGNSWQWGLAAGLDGNLGFSVGILGYTIADYNTTLLHWDTIFANNNGTITGSPPVADFTANTTSITAGGTVNFTDLSTNTPTSWSWDFGDGGISTLQNPSYTYSTTGTYTVSLTATNAYGSNIMIKNSYITVSNQTPTMTDPRDGQVYNTVLIGTQWWMAENLNYGTYVPVATGQGGAGTQKYCYGDNTANCTTYGGLYEWAEMMNGSASCNGTGAPPNDKCPTNVQGVCPVGWHIPSHYEWTTLEKNVGTNPGAFPYDIITTAWLGTDEGGNLKQTGTTNWTTPNTGATNSSGFTALPGGLSWSGSFSYADSIGYWWSSTEYSGTIARNRALHYTEARSYRLYYNKLLGYSVRCVQD